MIVRNESQVIGRCLDSVRPLLDYWVVCDTGSDDGTPAVVARELAQVPGELHHRDWRNFGANRSELMELARGKSDYLLLVDADMTAELTAPLENLSADAYLVRCGHEFEYWIPRLVRGDLPWHYTGVTHEYLDCAESYSAEKLPSLSVVHYGDGGSRADKLPRDKALLESYLSEHPDDERTVFYLAQTVRDLGERDAAIALFGRRATMGGFAEEAFYAAYQAAILTAETDPEAALPLLFGAWQLRPGRAEPVHEIARIALDCGWHQLARAVLAAALAVPPVDDRLFVHRWMRDWGLLFQYGIACYWTGEHAAGLQANDELLRGHELPGYVGAQALRNRGWCAKEIRKAGQRVPPLPPEAARFRPVPEQLLSDLVRGARFAEVALTVDSRWPQFNPSIAADPDGGFGLIVRSANYELFPGGNYLSLSDDDIVRTTNYLVGLDAGLQVRQVEPVTGDSIGAVSGSWVLGCEDCRLVSWRGDWWLTATRRDQGADGRCRMVLARLDGARLGSLDVLDAGQGDRDEKNWMPFIHDDELYFVYSCQPFVVLRFDQASRRLTEVVRAEVAHWPDDLRGGSQGLALEDGYLFVVHEVGYDQGERVYAHRFLRADADLQPAGLSRPFSFAHGGIEFCAGAALRGTELVLSFGLNDRVAALATAPLNDVLSTIEPLAEKAGANL